MEAQAEQELRRVLEEGALREPQRLVERIIEQARMLEELREELRRMREIQEQLLEQLSKQPSGGSGAVSAHGAPQGPGAKAARA